MAYNDLSHHYRSPYLRQLPHYRTYFPAIARSCNCFVRDLTVCPRRVAFLLIALMRTVKTGFFLLVAVTGLVKNMGFPVGIWIMVLFCLTAFTIELWNLHLIVEAEGEGMACGRRVPGGAFTLFMFWLTIWRVFILAGEVLMLLIAGEAGGLPLVEGISIALICVVAWIANKELRDEGLSLP